MVLNLTLAAGVFASVRFLDPPILAVVLILLSKWRILAVRPRYWFMNLKSNLVDILVGLSVVTLLYLGSESLPFQAVVTLMYAAWLLFLKPRSRRQSIIWQGGIAQFVALTAVASFSYALPSSVFVFIAWVIGYATTRHILSSYEEDSVELLSLLYGFILAELAWFYYHWMVAYHLVGSVAVPQLAIVVLLLSFVAQRLYDIRVRTGKISFKEVRVPLGFLLAVLAVLFIQFTPWSVVL